MIALIRWLLRLCVIWSHWSHLITSGPRWSHWSLLRSDEFDAYFGSVDRFFNFDDILMTYRPVGFVASKKVQSLARSHSHFNKERQGYRGMHLVFQRLDSHKKMAYPPAVSGLWRIIFFHILVVAKRKGGSVIWQIRVYCSRPWEHGKESREKAAEKMHDCGARKIDDLNNILGR